jgi:hypothetical protein
VLAGAEGFREVCSPAKGRVAVREAEGVLAAVIAWALSYLRAL